MKTKCCKNIRGKEGVALFTVTALLTLLSLVGSFAYMVIRTDMAISDNYVSATKAYYQAEAGIYYVRNWIETRLKNKTLEFSPGHNAVNIPAPAGYTFDTVTDIVQCKDTNAYTYTVTGRATSRSGVAESSVKVVAFRRPLLMCGVLGDTKLDFAPNLSVFSYDSNLVPNPTPPDSTGDATIGSNFLIEISPGVTLDGVVNIGAAEDGTMATYTGPADWTLIPFGRMDPDPLGIIGGEMAADFTAAIAANNNASLGGAVVAGPKLVMKKNTPTQFVTMTAGNYYFSEVSIGPGCVLTINDSAGPVRIFLDGKWYNGPKSDIACNVPPTSFSILSRSTEDIVIQPNSSFSAFLYAPYAEATFQPNGDARGVCWTELCHLKPGGDYFVDINLLKQFLSKELEFTAWKEVRM